MLLRRGFFSLLVVLLASMGQGLTNNGLFLDGVSSYVSLPTVSFHTSFTVECWLFVVNIEETAVIWGIGSGDGPSLYIDQGTVDDESLGHMRLVLTTDTQEYTLVTPDRIPKVL